MIELTELEKRKKNELKFLQVQGKMFKGLKCTLYEARQPSVQNNEGATQLFDTLKQIKSFPGILYSIFPEATNSSN